MRNSIERPKESPFPFLSFAPSSYVPTDNPRHFRFTVFVVHKYTTQHGLRSPGCIISRHRPSATRKHKRYPIWRHGSKAFPTRCNPARHVGRSTPRCPAGRSMGATVSDRPNGSSALETEQAIYLFKRGSLGGRIQLDRPSGDNARPEQPFSNSVKGEMKLF